MNFAGLGLRWIATLAYALGGGGCAKVEFDLGRDDSASVAAACARGGPQRLASLASAGRPSALVSDGRTIFAGTAQGIVAIDGNVRPVPGGESYAAGPLTIAGDLLLFVQRPLASSSAASLGVPLLRLPKGGGEPANVPGASSVVAFQTRGKRIVWEPATASSIAGEEAKLLTLNDVDGQVEPLVSRTGRGQWRIDDTHVFYPDLVERQVVIRRAALADPRPTVTTLFRYSLNGTYDPDVWDVDDTSVYLTPHGVSPMVAIDKATAFMRPLFDDLDGAIVDVAVGRDHAYWLTFARRRVFRVDKRNGGTPELVVESATEIASIAVVGCALVWIADREVWAMPQ